ncbi:MAG: MFS transporter [Ilumatobacteraceae bacterium]
MSNHPFRPLRRREVRLIWSAAAISDIGTWVQLIVVGSLVAADTGSAVQTGLVALATFMPQGIASPIGGILADRFDRRRVFARALLLQACMTGCLAIALGAGVRAPAVLTAIILLGSAAGALGQPSYAAMLPDLVPPDELVAMVSLGVYSWNSGRVFGPLIGTVLAAAVGPAWTIGFNAITFVGLSIAVWAVRRPFAPHGSDGTIGERLVGGWRALRTTYSCWFAVVALVLFNLTIVPFMGLIPIYARAEFKGGTGLAGLISSAQGIGAIVGGITITMLAARRRRSDLVAGVVVLLAVALACYAVAPTVAAVAVAAMVLGAGSSCMFVTVSAILQRDAPLASRGRVLAMMQAFMGVSYGCGLLFIGSIADLANLRIAFLVGAVCLPVGFFVLTRRARSWRAAIDGADVMVSRQVVTAS